MATYYKRFIPRFATIAAPLTSMTSPKKGFIWTPATQQAVEEIKTALKQAPLLRAPDFSKPFQLATDASKTGIGAVLQQEGQPIAYASRTCSIAEQNYQATEQEALDHKALHDLKSNRHPDEPLGRLMLKLQGLNHKITYLPGRLVKKYQSILKSTKNTFFLKVL